jgi:hypothetical protein
MRNRCQLRFTTAAMVVVCLIVGSPAAAAGEGPQVPGQPPPAQGNVVIQRVENGPAFGFEFKFTEINDEEAYLLGGYLGVLFDGKLFVGGAGYWQVDEYWNDCCYGYDDYYDHHYDDYDGYGYHGASGYGGLLVEAYPLRTSAVALSVRGLIGGGVTNVGWDDYAYIQEPTPYHGSSYPPPSGYYYGYDQGYFVFEPQVNVSVRMAPGLSFVGGVGYRVIAWADGWEDRIGGLTGTVAIRFGAK